MSAVKRVRKVLTKSLRTVGPAPKKASLQTRVEALRRTINGGREDEGNDSAGGGGSSSSSSSRDARVAVTVVGTGKAVDKVLSVAAWFEQDGDCRVCLRTKTVKTVDDIVSRPRHGHDEDAAESSRVRRVSGLEASIQLK